MLRYTSTTIGELVIKQNEKKFKIQIRQGNCLAVFIHVRKNEKSKGKHDRYIHTLYSFYADEQHLKKIVKEFGNVISDEITSLRLNMYYKECYTLLKYFVKQAKSVTCYYKEPKTKQK